MLLIPPESVPHAFSHDVAASELADLRLCLGHGSYATFTSRPISWSKEVQLKPIVTLQMGARLDRNASWKRHFCISRREVKRLKILAFKGNSQNDESGCRAKGSKVPTNSVKLSDVPQKGEETMMESTEIQESPLSYSSREEETIAGSPAIHKLFKKWLMMLRTQSSNQTSEGIFGDGPPQNEISESQIGSQEQEKGKILKAVWRYVLAVDATIKIPLLIFIPWYLVVNVVYGAEVSKELTPLWVLGPLIVALYIKILRGICALYVFSFNQTIRIAKNLPTYYLLAYNYMAQGQLKEDLRTRFWQPVTDMKNLDYKELSISKLKELEEWAVERYLDYRESIWPFYCRTIRFLKKAHLI
ncbi:hypothetical protein BVC80_233g16 [Macleaya cordata]|uniref:Uncharacterized protein n=1 Tax=Macleaya cordata TaxID=56857 RepID=A0A200RB19_MACCD|nr:hypothetical protein BVC80_233g16 [Macleaya cordata]